MGCLVLLGGLLVSRAVAQRYRLDHISAPGPLRLQSFYMFFVFAEDWIPTSDSPPYVSFQVSGEAGPNSLYGVDLEGGIQVSLLDFNRIWDLIDPTNFCCREGSCDYGKLVVRPGVRQPPSEVGIFTYTVNFTHPPTTTHELVRKTSAYALAISNCGSMNDAKLTGVVTVRNSYGFLPGTEYHKLATYKSLAVVYLAYLLVWWLLWLQWREWFGIQKCIGVVIVFGLLECVVWYTYLTDWNEAGSRNWTLFGVAVFLTVVKTIFSYMLVLVASLGWGVTRPFLENPLLWRLKLLCVCYIAADMLRHAVLSFQHTHSQELPMWILAACALPVSSLNGVIFMWVFAALEDLTQTLKERQQLAKFRLFQRLALVLFAALAAAVVLFVCGFFYMATGVTNNWEYQWMWADLAPEVIYILLLAAVMFLWAPSAGSHALACLEPLDAKERSLWSEECAIELQLESTDLVDVIGPNTLVSYELSPKRP